MSESDDAVTSPVERLVLFEMTTDGCAKAKRYLAEIDKLEEFKSNGFSVDGYSLIAYANNCKRKETNQQERSDG